MSQHPPRMRSRVFPLIQHHLAVHDHNFDAFAVLERLGVGRVVEDAVGVEDGDVGEHAWAKQAAFVKP